MEAIDLVYLFCFLEFGGNASVHCEVLAINYASDRHVIEELHEEIVGFGVVAGDDFLAEGEVLSHVPAFVVSS